MKHLALLPLSLLLVPAAAAQAPLYDLSGQTNDQFGQAVGWIGDVNGDGQEDIAVGAPFGDGIQPDAGYVRIVSAKTPGTLVTIKGERTGDRFGWSLAGLGDIDGDGVGDLIVGAPRHEWTAGTDRGAVYVLSGATGAQIWKLGGSADNDQLGYAVAGPGDVDGDGTPDYAMGVPWDSQVKDDGGIVWIHSGATHGFLRLYTGQAAGDNLGFALSAVGDLSGDSVPDLLAGAPGADVVNFIDAGRAYVLSGAASGGIVFSHPGSFTGGQLGYSVAGGLDANLDGTFDCVLGEPFANANGNSSGRALLISGATHAVLHAFLGSPGDTLGHSVGAMRDVDLDNRGDLVVGVPRADVGALVDAGLAKVYSGATGAFLFEMGGYHTAERFGQSVAGVGRLNNDLATDVIAGSPFFDGNFPDGGRVRVVLGAAPYPTPYCTPKTNSAGCVPQISFTGCASFSAGNYFAVHGYNVLPNMVGLLIWSQLPNSAPFLGGTLCVGAPLQRTAGQVSLATGPGPCDGRYEFQFNATYMSSQGLVPGLSLHAQYWSRDNGFAAPNNVGLTGGLRFLSLP